jgi:hypothetical protein
MRALCRRREAFDRSGIIADVASHKLWLQCPMSLVIVVGKQVLRVKLLIACRDAWPQAKFHFEIREGRKCHGGGNLSGWKRKQPCKISQSTSRSITIW